VAEDGEHALDLIKNNNKPTIDLLLTDVIMPKMNGKELADRLSQKYPGLKIIFFSGYTDEGIVQHGILQSGTEFIHKPFSQQTLVQKIRNVLDEN
jgi:YesN/AraC family two-component response regulator